MDINEFREFGKAAVDYIAGYYETLHERKVLPSVSPGYLRPLLPSAMPQDPECWTTVLQDVEKVIMPGMTHWASPHFHAYFPSGCSFPSVVGEMMCAALGVIGFSWNANPACTELELIMMDWLVKAMDLPKHFLNRPDSSGAGVFQTTTSESTLYAMLLAKERTVTNIQALSPNLTEQDIKSRLVCYSSADSNSSVERASKMASVPMTLLPTDEKGSLRGNVLKAAILKDLKNGLYPCYVCATLGTTGSCAFDCLEEIGPVCNQYKVWLHVDAAYAGAALMCPELRSQMKGLESADSLVINLHKWFLVSFDCAVMWFKSRREVEQCFRIERAYLKNQSSSEVFDLRHYQLPLGRKFRALKVWFTLRMFGVTGIQDYIRNHLAMGDEFQKLVSENSLFEVVVPRTLGVVGFCLKDGNLMTQLLVDELMERKNIYVIPALLNGKFFIRFVVCKAQATMEDIVFAWNEIQTASKSIKMSKESNEHTQNSTQLQSVFKNLRQMAETLKIKEEGQKTPRRQ